MWASLLKKKVTTFVPVMAASTMVRYTALLLSLIRVRWKKRRLIKASLHVKMAAIGVNGSPFGRIWYQPGCDEYSGKSLSRPPPPPPAPAPPTAGCGPRGSPPPGCLPTRVALYKTVDVVNTKEQAWFFKETVSRDFNGLKFELVDRFGHALHTCSHRTGKHAYKRGIFVCRRMWFIFNWGKINCIRNFYTKSVWLMGRASRLISARKSVSTKKIAPISDIR